MDRLGESGDRALLVAQARRCMGAPAVLAARRDPLGYERLSAEVERALASLAAMGIGRCCRVAVAVPDGAEAFVLMLSLMSGAVCVPCNPAESAAWWTAMLPRLRAAALVAPAGADIAAVVVARSLGMQVVRLTPRGGGEAGTFDLRAETVRPTVAPVPAMPEDVAIVFQTSGTTATPKLIPVTQAQLVARAWAQPIDAADRSLMVAPMFAAGPVAHSMLSPIAAGASIAFPDGIDEAAILRAIAELRPTCFSANPALLRALAERRASETPPSSHALRYIRTAGSPLPESLQRQAEQMWGVPVIQGYGISEAGTVAGNPLPPRQRKADSVGVSVGPPFAIVDEGGADVGPGATGEVVVRGPGVMSGYEGDPEANRTAFRDGWLRTGDLGYRDGDGYLFLVGRVKELVDRGGFKVSPAEVDAALMRHPDVAEAAAFGVPHPRLGEDLAMAVVVRAGRTVSPQQLREFALSELAPHKVPTSFVFVAALPRNARRKVDRAALARDHATAARDEFVAPRTAEEALVVASFAAVLGIDRVGVGDNFFALGGDSLRGAQAIARIGDALGLDLAVSNLFRWPVAGDLAAAIAQGQCAHSDPLPPLQRQPATRATADDRGPA
jgi:acyl-CoA synthetase (AMP-forming)/AMP-acid ligase II